MGKLSTEIAKQILNLIVGVFSLVEKIQNWWSSLTSMQKKNVRNNFQKSMLIIIFVIIFLYERDYYLGIIHRNQLLHNSDIAKYNDCKKNELESVKLEVAELRRVKVQNDSIKIVLAIYNERMKNITKK